MKLRALFLGIVLLAMSAGVHAAVDPTVQFIIPSDNSMIHSPDALILYWTPTQFAPTVVRDDMKLPPGKIVPGNTTDLHHLRVTLNEGKNTIKWIDPTTEKQVGEMTLYYAPPGSMKRLSKKENFKEFLFHKRDIEDRCDECHPIPEELETVRGRPMSPAGKACSACHPQIDKFPKLHEPSGTYDCFRCHETAYKPTRFIIATSQVGLCGLCHQSFATKILGSSKYVHGPVATGSCVICHDPHGGVSKGFTREKITTLCMRCHADTVARGVKNGLHEDLDCTDCHDPHGADNPELTLAKGQALCSKCHKDPTLERNGHPIEGHPVTAELDPSKPGRPMNCLSCHKAHGAADVALQKIFENRDLERRFCFRCHY